MRSSAMNDAEAEQALDRAIADGRVGGKHRCPRCGMRSNHESEAEECCRDLGPPSLQRIPESRFDR